MIRLKQYGLRRTGTNYLTALLRKNVPGVEVMVDRGGDKHELPSMTEMQRLREEKPTHFVVNVKHPYPWFVSFRKWHENLEPINGGFKTWACELWNWQYLGWLVWLQRNGGLVVRYEDLLDNMPSVLAQICHVIGVDAPASPQEIKTYVKCGGEKDGKEFDRISTVGFAERRAYWTTGAFMQDLSDQDVDMLDALIDWKLAKSFRYSPGQLI